MAAGSPDPTGAAREVSRLVREIVLWSQRWYAGRCTCGASRPTTSAGHLLTCDLTTIDQDGATLVCAYQIASAQLDALSVPATVEHPRVPPVVAKCSPLTPCPACGPTHESDPLST